MDIISPPQSPLEPLHGDVISADIAQRYKLFPTEWQSVHSNPQWPIITEISISRPWTPQSVFLSLKERASYSLKGPEKTSEAYSRWAPCRKPQTTRRVNRCSKSKCWQQIYLSAFSPWSSLYGPRKLWQKKTFLFSFVGDEVSQHGTAQHYTLIRGSLFFKVRISSDDLNLQVPVLSGKALSKFK